LLNASSGLARLATGAFVTGFAEYGNYDALGLAELVRNKEVSPGELLEEAIGRIERVNPRINAVIHKMYDHARDIARGALPGGPFTGVPFLIKDLLAVYAGQPMRHGSRSMRDFVPDHDSELVKRFKATGVITMGKTNTPELGLSPTTEPALFGPTHNPWDLTRTPSGSSGGSAAAVAARIVPMARGGDGGGSIRTPASACGVFGLKPSRGRNPVGPDIGEIWHGAVAEHVLTRSVRDSAAMLDATAGPDVGAPYVAPAPERPFAEEVGRDPGKLRIAYSVHSLLGEHVDSECITGVERTVELLRELGHEVVMAAPALDRKRFMRAYITLVAGETAADIEQSATLRGRKIPARELEISTRILQLLGNKISASYFNLACRYLQGVTRELGSFMVDHDLFLSPTLAQLPFVSGTLQPTRMESGVLKALSLINSGNVLKALGIIDVFAAKVFEFSAYTPVFNVTGQPAMSVPLHWSEQGLPVGMHFVARYGDEATLFRMAGQLERARPWADRKPPVCAD
jgi:amidase